MSRSGYTDDYDDDGRLNLWRANVDRTIRGKRGQEFLREMLAALDAMPNKRLIANEIVNEEGEACAIGSVALARKLDVSDIDESDPDSVGHVFGITAMLVQEIAYENDEREFRWNDPLHVRETAEEKWSRMRAWVAAHIIEPAPKLPRSET